MSAHSGWQMRTKPVRGSSCRVRWASGISDDDALEELLKLNRR